MSSNFHLKDVLVNSQYPFIAISSFLAATTIIAVILYTKRPKQNEPIPLFVAETSGKWNYKKRWIFDSSNLLKEAYKKFHDRPFRIWTTEGIQIGIHPKYVEEVKMLPDSIFPSALRSFFCGPYLWPIEQWKLDYPHVVLKNDLNKNLSKLFPDIRDVISVWIPRDLPECNDWTPVQVHPKAHRIISRVSTKIFVGNGLHENEEWLAISTDYTKNVFIASAKLRFFHPIVRPLAQYFISDLRTVWHCNRVVGGLLAPIISQRQLLEKKGDYKKPNDCIEWLRDLIPDPDRNDPHLHGILQLAIAGISIGSTAHLITNIIFNLATWPEYQSTLKQEIEDVLREAGGDWTLESMGQLKMMDSFMKESLRFNGHVTTTFQRLARQAITLSDGTVIPANTMVFTPAYNIANDPNIYHEPDTFDGFRFYNLRKRSLEDEKKYQFTTINKEQMQFGMGRHACSGRWLGSYQIKLTVASLICRYEFKLKEGEGRPKNTGFQTNLHPDLKGEVLFRKRK